MRIITITGVSGSWKTSLQEELIKRGWWTPLNFTTRPPRDDQELDYYVFIDRLQYDLKVTMWDFMEHMVYNGNGYGISKYYDKAKDLVLVLTPVGREIIKEYFSWLWIPVETYFVDLPMNIQRERLEKRGDKEKDIIKRAKDYTYFCPSLQCTRLDWELSSKELANFICKTWKVDNLRLNYNPNLEKTSQPWYLTLLNNNKKINE